MLKKMKKVAAITMMLCLLGASTVFAAAAPSAVITGTEAVTITDFGVSDFAGVTLDGTTQTITSTVYEMTLIDARGLGSGWSVNLTGSQFINGDLKTLPNSSLALGTVTIEAVGDSTDVTNIAIGSGEIDKTGGVKILNASSDEGMGTYTVGIGDMTLTLLPKDAREGTYTSTITMTLSQGPVS